ncbi:Rha family transcriptional regulator [Curvibacter sp. HBC61]|uniref:Rha family transcriptional regulator n=1 Tax=Curvibacter cyanobacteriorum TaxID=3026422 RepID=A0ABT5MYS7_9BURK|nr:Rha family transcriptional regulator [Curvibacter sp. HBC61]MDD0837923.1 Rha family transcriptional regulator [Curvibacter sp. HBC61]
MSTPITITGPALIATMTSREIAELTGKEHKHVLRDIRNMLDELGKDGPVLDHPQEDKDARGYTTCFHLNRELTDTLLTGYSIVARNKVIRRWHELETKAKQDQFLTLPPAVASQVGGIVKAVVHKELAAMIPELIQAELSKKQTSLRHGETAGQIWRRHGLPQLKNASRMLSIWLVKHGAYTNGQAEVGGVTSKLFDPDLADKAMREGVRELCWRYAAERQGQMLIEFSHAPKKHGPGQAIPLDAIRQSRKQREANEIGNAL